MIDNCKKSNINISQRLYIIYEGKIISYFVFCRKANVIIYYIMKNEESKMITDPKLLLQFVIFSKDSEGGINSVFYSSNNDNVIL